MQLILKTEVNIFYFRDKSWKDFYRRCNRDL